MNAETLAMIQKYAILHRIYKPDQPYTLRPEAVEKDRRSVKRAMAEIAASGYIEPTTTESGFYPVTDKAYNEIPRLDDLSLTSIWDRQRLREHRHKNLQFVRVGAFGWQPPAQLDFSESRYILDNHEKFEWFVVSTEAMSYNFDPSQDQFGPFTLKQSSKEWDQKVKQSSRWRDCEITVSSPELRQHVLRVVFNDKAEAVFKTSLGWGLAKLGVIDESEARLVKSTDMIGGALLMSSTTNVGDEPDQWEARLAASITSTMDRVLDLQKRLILMRKIEVGVVKYGGWPKFLADYRAALIDALIKQDEAKEEPVEA